MAQDLYSNLPPELFLQQKALNRQQEMAKMLLAQGAQQNAGPAGQMVSGRYVPNSFFQNLQGPVNQLLGVYMAEKGDKRALDLAEQLRKGKEQETQAIMEHCNPDLVLAKNCCLP
jgi:lipopolysaccharide biosynthesis regulator YciM